LGHGLQSYEDRSLAATNCRARGRSSFDCREQRSPTEQNSDVWEAAPSAGIRIASRKWPAVRLSISNFKRLVSLSAVSSHASHPQVGKAVVHQRPKRTRSPGKAEKATTMGAALTSRGTRVTLGRASLHPSSSSESRPCPAVRSTSNSSSKRSSNSAATSCRDANRSGFVTRE
jgi:hypothetical protein